VGARTGAGTKRKVFCGLHTVGTGQEDLGAFGKVAVRAEEESWSGV